MTPGCHACPAITDHRGLPMVQLYTRLVDWERLASAAIIGLSEHADKRPKERKIR
jgi:hypothetical protein